MTIEARIVRQTRKGDWVAKTDAGLEVLLPGSDTSLLLGSPVSLRGVRQGEHVNFPDGGYSTSNKPSPVLYKGIITGDDGQVGGNYLSDHWEALIAESGQTHLRKSTGPRNVDIGTLVDIHRIRKQGVVHRFIDDWTVSATQYPEHPLTTEQEQEIARISSENFNNECHEHQGRPGTVALYNPYGMAIVSDAKYPPNSFHVFDKRPRTEVMRIWSGDINQKFPIGTRVIYGPIYKDGRFERYAVFKLNQ